MANRTFDPVNALQKAVVLLEGSAVIDSGQSGKTRSVKGSGIKAIKNVATGTYKVQLDDPYFRYLGGSAGFVSAVQTATAVTAINPGTVYVIVSLGTTSTAGWHTAGVPASVTPAVGVAFVCAAVSTGSGSCMIQKVSGISCTEVLGDPNLTINNSADPHFFITTLAATNSSTTTLIAADPADGSVLGLTMWFRNSSVLGKGEK